jgi:uroporphyrinogen decarboxylase
MVGKNNLVTHMRLFPDEVKHALAVITETTINFLKATKLLGIDGIFYAIQHAQAGVVSPVEFEEFELGLDKEILSYCRDYWINIAHIHGENIYFDKISSLPVQVINWHDQQTKPNLQEAKSIFPGIVCGGLKQWETLVNGDPEMVANESSKALEVTNGERFMLGTGCVLPITAPHSNILAARESVEKRRN